jgi:hypothetical protein
LPFILLAEAGVASDASAMPDIASDRIMAMVLMFLSRNFVVRTYNHGKRD